MNRGLGRQAARAATWAFVSMMGARVITLIGLTVLARLLAPREFGLLAFAMAYIVYVETIGDLGSGTALIYWPDRRDEAAQVTFLINIAAGTFWCLATIALAPLVAKFFNAPHGIPIVRVLAVGFLIKYLGNTHDALTRKDLRFAARAIPELAFALIKAAVSVVMAWRGYGAWSLVWGHISGLTASTLLFWTMTPWRPSLTFPRDLLKPMLAYGRGIIFVNVLTAVEGQTDLAAVGRVLGMTALGLYQLAGKLPEATVIVIVRVASRVLMPAFSRVVAEGGTPKRAYLSAARYIAAVTMPVMAGLAILAHPLVLVFFGKEWVAAAPIASALAILAGMRALGTHPGDALKAMGRVATLVRIEVFRAVLIVIAVVVTVHSGAVAVAGSMAIVDGSAMLVALVFAARAIGVSMTELARAYAPAFAGTAAMTGVVLAWQTWGPSLGLLVHLGIAVTLGAVTYALVLAVTAPTMIGEARKIFAFGR
ncbi:MAG TPA: lipopolysaccharide biosynthesis protein [Thermoanaerobaculia bacterium]|jgi:O-antigen/teichoic acid export membrane protein|nr:lipopolysaccharide biosynthesis protein [Thermoanaerobaculia bacterium]